MTMNPREKVALTDVVKWLENDRERLIAEVAALREKWAEADALASKHFVALREKQDDAQMLYHRATEAERNLAEAVAIMKEWKNATHPSNLEKVRGLISTFLSKEAERG